MITSCKSIHNKLTPTYNNGGYKIKILKKGERPINSKVKIIETVYDKETGEILKDAKVKRDISIISEYKLSSKPPKIKDGKKYFFEAIFIGYKSVLTDYIDLSNVIEMEIDFYLVQDDRPLH